MESTSIKDQIRSTNFFYPILHFHETIVWNPQHSLEPKKKHVLCYPVQFVKFHRPTLENSPLTLPTNLLFFACPITQSILESIASIRICSVLRLCIRFVVTHSAELFSEPISLVLSTTCTSCRATTNKLLNLLLSICHTPLGICPVLIIPLRRTQPLHGRQLLKVNYSRHTETCTASERFTLNLVLEFYMDYLCHLANFQGYSLHCTW